MDGDWATFPTGSDYTFGGGLLQIKSTDLARLGMLMLYEGRWNQAQIVAPDWYTLSLTPIGTNEVAAFDPVTKEPVAPGAPVNVSYGLHWWLARGIALPPDGTITAIGLGGQLLVVYPEKELVIVVTCDASPDDRKPAIEAFLRTHVIDKLL